MLRMQMLGMGFEFLDTGVGISRERLGHHPTGLGGLGLGKALSDIADLVNPATLNMV